MSAAPWWEEGHLHAVSCHEGGLPPTGGTLVEVLLRDLSTPAPAPGHTIEQADDAAVSAYRALRHREFVLAQGLFPGTDRDDVDDDPRTVVLVARDADGAVLGGVRLAPATPDDDVGWWRAAGSSSPRQAVVPGPRWSAPPAPAPRPPERSGSTQESRRGTPACSPGSAGRRSARSTCPPAAWRPRTR
jgi:hypothetical protein